MRSNQEKGKCKGKCSIVDIPKAQMPAFIHTKINNKSKRKTKRYTYEFRKNDYTALVQGTQKYVLKTATAGVIHITK